MNEDRLRLALRIISDEITSEWLSDDDLKLLGFSSHQIELNHLTDYDPIPLSDIKDRAIDIIVSEFIQMNKAVKYLHRVNRVIYYED